MKTPADKNKSTIIDEFGTPDQVEADFISGKNRSLWSEVEKQEKKQDPFPAEYMRAPEKGGASQSKIGGKEVAGTKAQQAAREAAMKKANGLNREEQETIGSKVDVSPIETFYDGWGFEEISEDITGIMEYGEEFARACLSTLDGEGVDSIALEQCSTPHGLMVAQGRLRSSESREMSILAQLLPELMDLSRGRRHVAQASAHVIAASPSDDTQTQHDNFLKFLTGRDGYDLVRRAGNNKAATHQDSHVQAIADLLASGHIKKSVRAEALARFSLYISSGWAERDLQGDNPDEVALRIRSLIGKMRNNEPVSSHEISHAFQTRFDDTENVFVPCKYKGKRGGGTIQPSPQGVQKFFMAVSNDAADKSTHQGPGDVDAVIRNADDRHSLTVAIVTSDADFMKSRDQLARHVGAIQNALKECKDPFEAGDRISSIEAFCVALIPKDNRTELKDEMESAYLVQGMSWDDSDANFYNLLPLFSLLGPSSANGLDPNIVLQTRLNNFGAPGTDFQQRPEHEQVAEVIKHFKEHSFKLAQACEIIRLSKPGMDAPRKAFDNMFQLYIESVSGLYSAYGKVAEDDPRTSAQSKKTAKIVRDGISEMADDISKIVEMGSAQAGSISFVERGCTLLTDIKKCKEISKYEFEDEHNGIKRKIPAENYENAKRMMDREIGIINRQTRILDHLDEAFNRRSLAESTKLNLTKFRNTLARAAIYMNEEDINQLIEKDIGGTFSATDLKNVPITRGEPINISSATAKEWHLIADTMIDRANSFETSTACKAQRKSVQNRRARMR